MKLATIDLYKNITMSSTAVPGSQQSNGKIATVKIGDFVPEGAESSTKKIIGISLGAAALAGIAIVTFLTKGFSGGFYKKIGQYSEMLKKQAYELSAEVQNPTFRQKITLLETKLLQPIIDSFQAVSNINVIKDGGAMQVAKMLKATRYVDKLSGVFKNIVIKSKLNAYNKAEYAKVEFLSVVENAAKKSQNKKLLNLTEEIKKYYNQTFSTESHYKRTEKFWDSIKLLHERVWKTMLNSRKNKNIKQYKSYLTMDLSAQKRNAVYSELMGTKKIITNDIEDNYNALKNELNNIKINIRSADTEAVEKASQLSKCLDIYRKLNGTNENEKRAVLRPEIEKTLTELLDQLSGNPQYQNIEKAANKIKEILNPEITKKGLAQETITVIKNEFGKDSLEYKSAVKGLLRLKDNLNNAIETEMTACEKLAELRVGSALTDVLGILAPAALGTGLVIKEKTKEERISKTLTQGIPIIGGIATAYYGTTRMFTGPKNLAIGLGTAYLLNVLGTAVDKFYKKYTEKQSLFRSTLELLKKYQSGVEQ